MVGSLQPAGSGRTNTGKAEEKSGGRYNSILTVRGSGVKCNFSVLLDKEGGFPEASLDDRSAAELSGLKEA